MSSTLGITGSAGGTSSVTVFLRRPPVAVVVVVVVVVAVESSIAERVRNPNDKLIDSYPLFIMAGRGRVVDLAPIPLNWGAPTAPFNNRPPPGPWLHRFIQIAGIHPENLNLPNEPDPDDIPHPTVMEWIEGGRHARLEDEEGDIEPIKNNAPGIDSKKFLFQGPQKQMLGESEDVLLIRDIPNDGIRLPEEQYTIPDLPVWAEVHTERFIMNLRKFDFALIRPDYTHVIYGKRRTGKTHYIRCLMKAMRPYYPEVWVFTGTKIDAEYEACVPKRNIVDGFREEVLDLIMKRQARRVEEMRKRKENNENIYVLIVLDDCITEKMDLATSEVIRRAFFNGRHLYMSIMINSQDLKALGPNLRANTDMVACFRVRSERDKDAVRTNYADFFKNNEEFDAVAGVVADVPFNILFIDQSRPYMKPEDSLYCAVMPPDDEVFPFFMGSRSFWNGSESQLAHYGGETLIDVEDWGLVNTTYNFHMNGVDMDKIDNASKAWFRQNRDKFVKETITPKVIHVEDDSESSSGSDGEGSSSDSDRASGRQRAQVRGNARRAKRGR